MHVVKTMVNAMKFIYHLSVAYTMRHTCFSYSEDVAKLKHLSLCLKESLRLYPSVPNVHRDLEEDVEIEGYRIPKDIQLYTCAIKEIF